MRYQGGKSRLAKYIVPILESHRRGRPFVEPFCGGCSITARMTGERYAYDLHRGLITMWQAVQNGWEPPAELSREEWYSLREANDHDNPLTAFAAFGCSFGGVEWTAPVPGSAGSARSLLRKARSLGGVRFECASVFDLRPANSLVYCDPPYAGTKGYTTANDSNRAQSFGNQLAPPPAWYDRFWQWCRDAASRGCTVLVSEYNAPPDMCEVWQRDRRNGFENAPPSVDLLSYTDRLFLVSE